MASKKALSPTQPVLVTANRLRDGRSVWRGAEGWVERIDQAVVLRGAAVARAAAAAEADVAARHVVAPYLVFVADQPGVPAPLSEKERIRAAGPSVRYGVAV